MEFNLILLMVVGVIVAGSADHIINPLPGPRFLGPLPSDPSTFDPTLNAPGKLGPVRSGPVFNSPTSRYRPASGPVKTGPFLNGTASTEPAYSCGRNEVYKTCGVGWQCEDYCGRGADACAQACVEGCYCAPGYIRSGPEYTAKCILENQCPMAQEAFAVERTSPRARDVIVVEKTVEIFCKVNEVFSECRGCDQYCNREPVFCTADCRPGCSCRKGYVRSFEGGICIPAEDCPAKVQPPVENFCRVNEVYSDCRGCDQYCNREPVFCTADCRPGCSCRKGYVRSFEGGICILPKDCPAKVQAPELICSVNEVYRECGCCDNYCNREPVFCTADCRSPGCCCQNGYVRSFPGGICIPANTCPRDQNNGPAPVQSAPPPQCRVNEVYNSCGGCDQICNSEPIACAQDCSRPGCYCRSGYVRSFKGGICIPRNDCPRNQNTGTGPVQNPRPRNQNNVPGPVQNPPGEFCEVNEVYRECGCCDNYCNREPVACTADCRSPGCCCQNGYVRSFPGGICIPKNSCPRNQNNGPGPVQSGPPPQCRINEEYNSCGGCDQICNSEPIACAQDCSRPGCYCKKGFVRSFKGGICIPQNECARPNGNQLKCKGPHEVFACGSACQTTCENLGKPCPIVNIKCNDACYCKEGYARNKHGICINQKKC